MVPETSERLLLQHTQSAQQYIADVILAQNGVICSVVYAHEHVSPTQTTTRVKAAILKAHIFVLKIVCDGD